MNQSDDYRLLAVPHKLKMITDNTSARILLNIRLLIEKHYKYKFEKDEYKEILNAILIKIDEFKQHKLIKEIVSDMIENTIESSISESLDDNVQLLLEDN